MKEEVAVIAAKQLFKRDHWQGIKVKGVKSILASIRKNLQFKPRLEVECDPSYKQIIPYLVFRTNNRYLLIKRLAHSKTEERLHHHYTLGLGGHINKGDIGSENLIEAGFWREWEEEVEYSGKIDHRLIGLIYDESTEVSRVHIGLFYLIEGDSSQIGIREVDRLEGVLVQLSEAKKYYDEMEGWSKFVYEYLSRENQGKSIETSFPKKSL